MIQNKRDLGGIHTADGKKIRPGLLIRSAHLFQANDLDLKGVSAIIDLRTPGERWEKPDQTCGRRYLPLPVFDDITAGVSHEKETRDRGIPDMAFLYGKLIQENTESFRSILYAIMRHDFTTGAILWHCSEGKDRCGMTTALVLEALGVNRKAIMDDYLKTNLVNMPKAIRIRDELLLTHGQAFAESVYRAYIADERYLQSAWDAMGDRYISDRLGIQADELEKFRNSVLEVCG